MRQLFHLGLILTLLAALCLAVWSGCTLWRLSLENGYIRAVAEGRSPALPEPAGAYALYARTLDLARRDRAEEAEGLLPRLTDLPLGMQAAARYAIGNARLRVGYALLDVGRADDAVPHVNLAKSAYRAALHLRPGDHDARLNLALAMRLVRDLPRPLQSGAEEEEQSAPRQLWTDLPGLPRGAP